MVLTRSQRHKQRPAAAPSPGRRQSSNAAPGSPTLPKPRRTTKRALPNVDTRRRRGRRPGVSLGSASFSPSELDLPLELRRSAPFASSELRQAVAARRGRQAAARKIASRLGNRVRKVLGQVVVPRSLRSQRAWTLRDWSEHPASSPPEVERVDLLLFSNVRALFVKEMAARLKRAAAAASSVGAPNEPKELRTALESLQRAYGISVSGRGTQWRFSGPNKAAAEEAVGKAGRAEVAKLTVEAVTQALAAALAKVDQRAQELTARRGYTLWETKQRRRSGASFFPGAAPFVPVAAGRRSRRIVGRSLLPYQLPDDLRGWLEGLGIRYDPARNPRLRQRVRGLGTRPRFVWGYNRGLDAAKAQVFVNMLRAGARNVGARRNWAAVHPEVMQLRVSRSTDPAPSAAKVMADAVKRLAIALKKDAAASPATAIYTNFETGRGAGHANLVVVGLRRGSSGAHEMLVRILDPHASDTLLTSATRAVLGRISAAAAAKAGLRLDASSPAVLACTFRPASKQRAMRVQYGKEGVCGPSAFALLLSTLRQIAVDPGKLWHARFCDRAYGNLRIQDAVAVMQVIQRL